MTVSARWISADREAVSPGRATRVTAFGYDTGMMRWWWLATFLTAMFVPLHAVVTSHAADPDAPLSVQDVARMVRNSIVTIRHAGRSGKSEGLGTGFVVSPDGLIATNLHVIGEARPITVELADGRHFDVIEVHASDQASDLAVVRIAAAGLPPLMLGDPRTLSDGQEVIAVGNPLGLERSVVAGHVSSRRRIDDRAMIQVAIPIEQGNSGGPLLDLHGQVQGVLTLKSTVNANIGFAVTIDQLAMLLANPNPVLMTRWVTIGGLDPTEWTPVGGATWRHRAGRVTVGGTGTGFGGRALCLSSQRPPAAPYEVAVWVRLTDESGAAGLIFAADGGDRHYGFYPSNGKLRLTSFDGPDVLAWRVLQDVVSPAYRAGDWNHLRVHFDADRFECFVNDERCIVSTDRGHASGWVGLAKFRDTAAEFHGFAVGKTCPRAKPAAAVVEQVVSIINAPTTKPPGATVSAEDTITQLLPIPDSAAAILAHATTLERETTRLRQLASDLRNRRVLTDLATLMADKPDSLDPFQGALLIARLDNPELDTSAVERDLERLADAIRKTIPDGADDALVLSSLDQMLFAELGFHGSRGDYYNRANSYINEVLDDREGIPITLAVLYISLARRLGVTIDGIGLPGHFIVRHTNAMGEHRWLDIFEKARPLSRNDLASRVRDATGEELMDRHLEVAKPRAIIARILNNLLSIASRENDTESMLRYLEAILVIEPQSARDRLTHMVVAGRAGRVQRAIASGQWLLDQAPEGIDLDRVQKFLESMEPLKDVSR